MVLWEVMFLLQVLAPWISAATVAGVVAWYIAEDESRHSYSVLAVLLVSGSALASTLLPGMRAKQLDNLRFEEAVMFCSASPVRVLKPLPAADPLKFGVYDDYLGLGGYKTLDIALRSRQTQPDSRLQKIAFVLLKRGERAPEDVYPVVRRGTAHSHSLSVIEPRTGEIIAYTNYIHGQETETRSRYVGCDRQSDGGDTSVNLEAEELFVLLGSLVPGPIRGAPQATAGSAPWKRNYDIERGGAHVVREDCSKGLTVAPSLQSHLDYRYLRDADDLAVLVLDRKAWDAAIARKDQLAMENRAPVLWQHFHPAITCKGYFADDGRAGPVFHPGGYEEPVARVRADGQEIYRPFDYGPHRKVRCNETIVTGTVRPGWHYVLKREGNNLVLADLQILAGEPIKVTPLVTCEAYFDAAAGPAPDIRLGVGGSTREVRYPASRVLSLGDGAYLGEGASDLAARMKQSLEGHTRKSVRAMPPPSTSSSERQGPQRSTGERWPAKPRTHG